MIGSSAISVSATCSTGAVSATCSPTIGETCGSSPMIGSATSTGLRRTPPNTSNNSASLPYSAPGVSVGNASVGSGLGVVASTSAALASGVSFGNGACACARMPSPSSLMMAWPLRMSTSPESDRDEICSRVAVLFATDCKSNIVESTCPSSSLRVALSKLSLTPASVVGST